MVGNRRHCKALCTPASRRGHGKWTVAGHATERLHRLGRRPSRNAISPIFKSEQQCDQRILFKCMGDGPAGVDALWQNLPR
jgi:hypothetical protein